MLNMVLGMLNPTSSSVIHPQREFSRIADTVDGASILNND